MKIIKLTHSISKEHFEGSLINIICVLLFQVISFIHDCQAFDFLIFLTFWHIHAAMSNA